MKKIFQTIFVLSIVFLNAAFIFGQEKSLEKSVFESIVGKVNEKLEGKTYRTVNIYEIFSNPNAAPLKIIKIITERVPPDKFRWIQESEGQKIETIRIGDKTYKRENDGKWEEVFGRGIGRGMGCGAAETSESFKATENVNLDGKIVNLYEKRKKLNDVSCGNQGKSQMWTEKYWISKDGLLVKTENLTEDLEKKTLKRDVTVYEYDPNIKIEAPIK